MFNFRVLKMDELIDEEDSDSDVQFIEMIDNANDACDPTTIVRKKSR